MQKLNTPQPRVYVKALRKGYDAYKKSGDVKGLLGVVQEISTESAEDTKMSHGNSERRNPLKRADLKLVCFDYVWW